jgi:hypothetical protein
MAPKRCCDMVGFGIRKRKKIENDPIEYVSHLRKKNPPKVAEDGVAIVFFSKLEPGLFSLIASYFSIPHFVPIQEAFCSNKMFSEHFDKRIRNIMRKTWSEINSKEALVWIMLRGIKAKSFKLKIFPIDSFVDLCSTKRDWDLVKHVLEVTEVDVNEKDTNGKGPLTYACEAGETDIITMLCEKGAETKKIGKHEPFNAAVRYGYYDVLPILIRYGVAQQGRPYREGEMFYGLEPTEARKAYIVLEPSAGTWLERARMSTIWIPDHWRALICIFLLYLECWLIHQLWQESLRRRSLGFVI